MFSFLILKAGDTLRQDMLPYSFSFILKTSDVLKLTDNLLLIFFVNSRLQEGKVISYSLLRPNKF